MSSDLHADRIKREASAARSLIEEIASDDSVLNHDLVEGETSLFEAIQEALLEADQCDVIIEGCRVVEGNIAARREKAAERKKRIRGLIEQAMVVVGIDTAKLPTATVTVRKVKPKPIVSDEAEIPAEFWKQPDPVLDRAKINKLEAAVPGIVMSNGGTSLQIRRV